MYIREATKENEMTKQITKQEIRKHQDHDKLEQDCRICKGLESCKN